MKQARRAQEKLASTDLGLSNDIHRSTKPNKKTQPMIYEQLPIGIVESSLQGECLDANEEFCRMAGYEKEQLLGRGIKDIVFEQDYPMVINLYHQLAEGRIPFYTLETRYVRKDGKIIWVEANHSLVRTSDGRAPYIIGAVLDVSKLKRAEEALRELNSELERRVQERTAELQAANQVLLEQLAERKQAEELLRSWAHIFEHADWGIATVLEDRFVMVNPTFATMHGYAVEELIGRSIYDVLAPESHAEIREQIRIAYRTGHNVYESKHIRKDGSVFPALVDTSVIRDNAGNVLYRAISIQDIAERKQAEKALEESRQHLQELSRRLVEVQEEERQALARELHDRIGQNLYALKLNLEMMENQSLQDSLPPTNGRLKDSLHLLGETTKLVRDLLNELRPSTLDDYGLKVAMQGYIDEFIPRYGIKIMLDIANEPLPRLHPSLEITLLRIVQEALTNIARHAQADQATVAIRLENNFVCLTVSDDGVGMQASQGTTDHISHGLKIMRERAEAFGGTVQIGSSEGKGTKVEVVIPILRPS